jgi:hypothetical protein
MKGRAVSTLVVGACAWFFYLKADAESIPQMVARAKQAVIQVDALDAQGNVLGTGTAFFIHRDGTAVTNAHVIKGATRLVGLTNTGAEYRFERVISLSQDADLAILKFSAADVPYLTLGPSREAVEGQRVLVIGNPRGLQGTVSDGLISAFRADHAVIQVSAPISPGSSGSPVLNEDGQVIGVAFLQFVNGQNLNFAIASEEVEKAERLGTVDGSTRLPTQVAAAPGPSPIVPDTPQEHAARARCQDAVEAGDTAAMVELGRRYEDGLGVVQDFAQAHEWYLKAAQAGNALGMKNLGVLYQNGRGVAQDYAQARRWFQKAAQAGNVDAMAIFGGMYEFGLGGVQDYAQARRWLQKAANAGNAIGMTALGMLYENGWGVARSARKADEWYRKAATVQQKAAGAATK